MSRFKEELKRKVLLCDGAMGTMLYSKGAFVNRSFDELNITQPDLVRSVHSSYAEVGVDVIETNTFGANRVKLETFGLGDQLEKINEAGVLLAREAAGAEVFVAGALGPLGILIEPSGNISQAEARSHFSEQAIILAVSGVDLFILETFRSVEELVVGVAAVRSSWEGINCAERIAWRHSGGRLQGLFTPA